MLTKFIIGGGDLRGEGGWQEVRSGLDMDDDDVVEEQEDFDRAAEKSDRGVTDCVSI